jgi:uncharacterized protein YecE (DUF72 family)
MRSSIYIGIAGWSYPDWQGIVFESAKTDHLEFISRFVDCIEINNTFYRPPEEKNSVSWLKKTSAKKDFFFTAKLHRDITHEGKFEPEMVKQFHAGFEPLLKEGKLRKLLVQFKYDFDDTKEHREYLEKIIKSFSDVFDLAIELRHKSWEEPEALEFLEQRGVTVCNLDYPTTWNSFNLQNCTVGKNGYFRLHGRNFEKWFDKEAGKDETYNYYYNEKELGQIKKRTEELSKVYDYLIVIANNHYRGAELANALELKCLLTGRKQEAPEKLLQTYPQLGRIASNKLLF